jgi:hypothetical protein
VPWTEAAIWRATRSPRGPNRRRADGLVLVGLGEGFLLGVVYYFAGVPHPVLLGAFTAK